MASNRLGRSCRTAVLDVAALAALAALACFVRSAHAAAPSDLSQLSLQDLANIEVSSVSKSSEPLQQAAAAVYVITHDDLERSAASNIPEALRLAPNLLVTQTNSTSYTISARGVAGNPVAQNFSNKLLILIDGRSVYTPLFSGIYTDTIDVPLEEVDRIEVISGVGATLWGANAMDGVINIITRPSYLSRGAFVDAAVGNDLQTIGARYGDRLTPDSTYRVYGLGFHRGAMETADQRTARDGWSKGQGGFRGDWSVDQDALTVQGDFYRGSAQNPVGADNLLLGGNVLARYQHHGTWSETQIQFYDDDDEQFAPTGGTGYVVHTYDLALQQALNVGAMNRVVWGGGERVYDYGITNTESLSFVPPAHALTLGNLFIQDTLALRDALHLIAGIKMEDDPFSGWAPLPDVRLAWDASAQATLWAAASRAIRSPTPFDDEVIEKAGTITSLVANSGFRPEKLVAYEVGARTQASASVTASLAAFYNAYDDLKTIEPASSRVFLPLYWGNSLKGHTAGLDAWGSWQVFDWWRLSPAVSWVRERLEFKTGASQLLGVGQAGDDPSSHASLTSTMDLPQRWAFDADFRYVGALPSPAERAYCELDARASWQAMPGVRLSISGVNLLHAIHTEFPPPIGEEIIRSIYAEARVSF